EYAETKTESIGGDATCNELFRQCLPVRRSAGDDVRLQVEDERRLPFGHAARDGHDAEAELLRTTMKAEASREEAVSVGVVEQHAWLGTGGGEAACVHLGEEFQVVAGVADDGRFPRGAGGGV